MKSINLFVTLFVFSFAAFGFASSANAAEIVLSPNVGNYATGDSFAIEIQVDPQGVDVNAAVAELSFDNTILSVISISKVGSDFSLWTIEPTFSNVNGTINFGAGTASPFSSMSTVVTATFEAQSGGAANVNVSNATILAADGLGTDVYSGSAEGVYEISGAPAVPVIEPVTQTINLEPGWNIVSTPKVLDSHAFSVAETSENFDIYILDASNPTGWSTMPDLGQSEFTPLFGYFIQNKTGVEQTLTFNYDTTLEPNEKLFERTFPGEGWYSIGVANDEYAKDQNANREDTNNPSKILSLLEDKYDLVIDFTDAEYASHRRSVALTNPWKAVVPTDIDNMNDFRETKGYAVYIKESGTAYTGFQNDAVFELIIDDLKLASSDEDPDATTLEIDEDNKTEHMIFAFELDASYSDNDVTLDNFISVNVFASDALNSFVNDFRLEVDGNSFDVESYDGTGKSQVIDFDIDGDIKINALETVTVMFFANFNDVGSGFGFETIAASTTPAQIDAEGADDIAVTGSSIVTSDTHTVRTSGLDVNVSSVSVAVTTADGSLNDYATYEIELDVTAFGEDVYILTDPAVSISYTLQDGSGSTSIAGTRSLVLHSTADEVGNYFVINEGNTENVTLVVTYSPGVSGITARLVLNSVSFNNVAALPTQTQILSPASDYRTSIITIVD